MAPAASNKDVSYMNRSYPTDEFDDIELGRMAAPAHPQLDPTTLLVQALAVETQRKVQKSQKDEDRPSGRLRQCGKLMGRHILGMIGLFLIVGCSIVLPMVLYATHNLQQ